MALIVLVLSGSSIRFAELIDSFRTCTDPSAEYELEVDISRFAHLGVRPNRCHLHGEYQSVGLRLRLTLLTPLPAGSRDI